MKAIRVIKFVRGQRSFDKRRGSGGKPTRGGKWGKPPQFHKIIK